MNNNFEVDFAEQTKIDEWQFQNVFFPGDPKKINDRFDSDLAGYVKENRWQI